MIGYDIPVNRFYLKMRPIISSARFLHVNGWP